MMIMYDLDDQNTKQKTENKFNTFKFENEITVKKKKRKNHNFKSHKKKKKGFIEH